MPPREKKSASVYLQVGGRWGSMLMRIGWTAGDKGDHLALIKFWPQRSWGTSLIRIHRRPTCIGWVIKGEYTPPSMLYDVQCAAGRCKPFSRDSAAAVVYGHFVKAVNHCGGGGGGGGDADGGWRVSRASSWWPQGGGVAAQEGSELLIHKLNRHTGFSVSTARRPSLPHRWEVDDRPTEKMQGVSRLNRNLWPALVNEWANKMTDLSPGPSPRSSPSRLHQR